jgi:tetratricopeptide (TPR) repeat protein
VVGRAAIAHYLRGFAYNNLGETQKAIADLQKAANLFHEQNKTAQAQKILEALKKSQQY